MCDDSFSDTDAGVVCRQLGYSATNAVAHNRSYYGAGGGTIWLDDVDCYGTEQRLSFCSHSGWGVHDCAHSEDVGVSCSKSCFMFPARARTSGARLVHCYLFAQKKTKQVCYQIQWHFSSI